MKIKKKLLCQITGISPSTLRYYVDERIITPEQDCSNGYYYYSNEDALLLLGVRELRSLGFSMEEAASIIRQRKNDEQTTVLFQQKRRELEEEKIVLEKKIRVLDSRMGAEMHPPEGVYLYHAPNPTHAAFFDGHHDSTDAVRELHNFLPFSQLTLKLISGTPGFHPGLTIEYDAYENLKALARPGIMLERLSQKRILLYKTLPDLSIISAEDFEPVFDYARRHRFKVTSDVFCVVRQVFVENEKTGCVVFGGVCYADE